MCVCVGVGERVWMHQICTWRPGFHFVIVTNDLTSMILIEMSSSGHDHQTLIYMSQFTLLLHHHTLLLNSSLIIITISPLMYNVHVSLLPLIVTLHLPH